MNVSCVASCGKIIVVGTADGAIFRSTNNGDSWVAANAGLTDMDVTAFAVSGSNVFAATGSSGVFLSTDIATSWKAVNSDIHFGFSCLAVSDKYIIAGTTPSGSHRSMYRRPLSQTITSSGTRLSELPRIVNLGQNYPNPFNSSTNISFTLPSKSFVSLKVFDALGREAAVLLGEDMAPGTYSRQWRAANVPSGIYLYRLQAGEFMETKKMILLR